MTLVSPRPTTPQPTLRRPLTDQPTEAPPSTGSSFGSVPVHADIARAIADLGWVAPTPVQEQAIPILNAGRDLLAQDYLLKQLAASLMYPEDELGKEFWGRVYQKAN